MFEKMVWRTNSRIKSCRSVPKINVYGTVYNLNGLCSICLHHVHRTGSVPPFTVSKERSTHDSRIKTALCTRPIYNVHVMVIMQCTKLWQELSYPGLCLLFSTVLVAPKIQTILFDRKVSPIYETFKCLSRVGTPDKVGDLLWLNLHSKILIHRCHFTCHKICNQVFHYTRYQYCNAIHLNK